MTESRAPGQAEQEALRGSREAWDALVARHGRAVTVALVARGVPLEKAKDLAQAAWMRLVEQQRAGKLQALLLPGLAIAQAIFLWREEARRAGGMTLQLDEAAQVADGAADPEARALGKQQLERAQQELEACSGSAREVFRLAYEGTGMAHAEIAQRTGLSLQRVRQVLTEVRKRLREAVGPSGPEAKGEEQGHD
ncbi:MAG: sigma-70 family RNA polymerase sigma factor [Myxococcales bacterium]